MTTFKKTTARRNSTVQTDTNLVKPENDVHQSETSRPLNESEDMRYVHQPRYSLDELIANAQQLFDVKPEVVHGVFHANDQKSFTIQEAEQHIQQFMKAKVK